MHRQLRHITLALATTAVAGFATTSSTAAVELGPQRQAIYKSYEEAARAADPAFAGFDAARGEQLFRGKHAGGKPETPSCTACHTTNLKGPGETRAGKRIEPMAASVNPKRYTDPKDVAKWFKRNCGDVLGRECTAQEKGDVLTYLLGQ